MYTEEITTQLSEVTRASSQEFVFSFTLGWYCPLCSLRRLSLMESIALLNQRIQERLQKAHGVTHL